MRDYISKEFYSHLLYSSRKKIKQHKRNMTEMIYSTLNAAVGPKAITDIHHCLPKPILDPQLVILLV